MQENPISVINEKVYEKVTGTLAASSGVSIGSQKLIKSGNVVFLECIFTTTEVKNLYNNLFIVPNGFIPEEMVLTPVVGMNEPTIIKHAGCIMYIDRSGSGCAGGDSIPVGTYGVSCTYIAQ